MDFFVCVCLVAWLVWPFLIIPLVNFYSLALFFTRVLLDIVESGSQDLARLGVKGTVTKIVSSA